MLGAFIMVIINVNTMKRLRWFAFVMVACSCYMAGQSLYSYEDRMGSMTASSWTRPRRSSPGEIENVILPRLRHLGAQADPNDFAQLLAIMLPLVALPWRRCGYLLNYLVLLPTMAYLFWVIYLTHSRGGLVASGLLALLALRERLGKVKAAILTSALFGVFIIFNLSAGRAMKDASSDARASRHGPPAF